MNTTSDLPQISATDALLEAPSTIYADQLAQLSIGPFVSKLTFGHDRKPGEIPAPVQTIVMPTPALLLLARQVMQLVNTEQVATGIRSELSAYLAALTPPAS